jgi:FHA domain-containing protein
MDPLSRISADDLRTAPLQAGRLVSLPAGKSHLVLGTPVTTGREPSCTIRVEGDDVSRSHAYVLRTPEGYLLVEPDEGPRPGELPLTSQHRRRRTSGTSDSAFWPES